MNPELDHPVTASLDLAVLCADDATVARVVTALGPLGLDRPVRRLKEPFAVADAPAVLVLFAGRGITARDALLHRLHSQAPDTRIVVVGPADSPASVRTAIESGAHGVVFEESLAGALAPTVLAAAAGQTCVPDAHRRSLGTPTFTPREKQILSLVVLGMSNHEIGAQLYLANSTVKSHLSSAFSKLGVRSRHEAVRMIIDPEQRLGLGILGISDTSRRAIEVPS